MGGSSLSAAGGSMSVTLGTGVIGGSFSLTPGTGTTTNGYVNVGPRLRVYDTSGAALGAGSMVYIPIKAVYGVSVSLTATATWSSTGVLQQSVALSNIVAGVTHFAICTYATTVTINGNAYSAQPSCFINGTTLYIQFYGYNNGTTSPTISVTAATPNLYVLVVATDGTGLTSTVTAA